MGIKREEWRLNGRMQSAGSSGRMGMSRGNTVASLELESGICDLDMGSYRPNMGYLDLTLPGDWQDLRVKNL